MGLDLTLIPKDEYLIARLDETSFHGEIKKTIRKAIQDEATYYRTISLQTFEYLVALGRLSSRTEEDTYFINLFYHLYGPNSQLPDLQPLLAKYKFIIDDEALMFESKVGSYSTIHYLRSFCDKVFEYLQKGIPANTEETVREILEECVKSGWDYTYERCPALCYHSDCEGYYLPTTEPFDFEHSSSYKLAIELDRLYSSGAIDILNNKFRDKAGVGNILWSFKILMYYALSSLEHDEILEFC